MNWFKRLFYDIDLIKWKIDKLEQLVYYAEKCGKNETAKEHKEELERLKNILK